MANENNENQATTEKPPKKGKGLPIVVVAVLMAVEGAGVFALVKWLSGSPSPTMAEDHAAEPAISAEHGESQSDHDGHGDPSAKSEPMVSKPGELSEVALVDLRTINNETGKLIVIQIRVSVLVLATEFEKAQKLIESKKSRIEDKVNYVLRSADPKHLKERGLDTIKRRLKYELDMIFEEENLIREVLIPQMLQSGSGL